MTSKSEFIPFDGVMCVDQFAQTVGFVAAIQGSKRTERACKEAERRCSMLFDEFYSADDRTEFMTMLAYLSMDLAANIAYTLDRMAIAQEVDDAES